MAKTLLHDRYDSSVSEIHSVSVVLIRLTTDTLIVQPYSLVKLLNNGFHSRILSFNHYVSLNRKLRGSSSSRQATSVTW